MIPMSASPTDTGMTDAAAPPPGLPRPIPSHDVLHELRQLRDKVAQMSRQIAATERARDAAKAETVRAIAMADRAERAERQISADRDHWRALALTLEAEIRSLAPRRVTG